MPYWDLIAEDSNYTVSIGTVTGKNKKKCTIKNLKSGKKYYIQMRAIKKIKGKIFKGNYTKIKAAKAK